MLVTAFSTNSGAFTLVPTCTQTPVSCTNTTAFGNIAAPTSSAPVTISSCNFAGEYTTVTGCVSGSQYTFASTGGTGNYLTIRQGTPGGAILGQGTSPVTVTCTASRSTIYAFKYKCCLWHRCFVSRYNSGMRILCSTRLF